MTDIITRFQYAIRRSGLSYYDLEKKTSFSRSALQRYASGATKKIPIDCITEVAEVCGVSAAWILGWTSNTPEIAADTVTFPVIGEIAAGYDCFAEQSYDTSDTVEIPKSYLKGKNQTDFLVLRVRGESMYPMYLNNDIVLVERSEEKPASGQILAVRYEDFATIKKVEFDDAFEHVKFIPINPMYPTKELSTEEKEQFAFIGYPKVLVRNI